MNLAFAAKQSGNGSLLWPSNCASIEDIPWDLTIVIEHAYRILQWQENLGKDEMPPKWMWHLEKKLESWFRSVDEKRKERYGVHDKDSSDDEPVMKNEYAERFGK